MLKYAPNNFLNCFRENTKKPLPFSLQHHDEALDKFVGREHVEHDFDAIPEILILFFSNLDLIFNFSGEK